MLAAEIECFGDPIPQLAGAGTGIAGSVSTEKNKNPTIPPMCQRCARKSGAFHSAGHPDDGMEFFCGFMVEAMQPGAIFENTCVHYDPQPSKPMPVVQGIIDSDAMNRKIWAGKFGGWC